MDPRPERGGRNLRWSSVGCVFLLDNDVNRVERDVGVKLDECGASAVGEEHECVRSQNGCRNGSRHCSTCRYDPSSIGVVGQLQWSQR
jgi:hypothetical protein